VEALINLYASGEHGPRQLGDAPVYLVNGKRVEKNPWEDESVPPSAIKWCEVWFSTPRWSTYITVTDICDIR
jgi:hypothetical protein